MHATQHPYTNSKGASDLVPLLYWGFEDTHCSCENHFQYSGSIPTRKAPQAPVLRRSDQLISAADIQGAVHTTAVKQRTASCARNYTTTTPWPIVTAPHQRCFQARTSFAEGDTSSRMRRKVSPNSPRSPKRSTTCTCTHNHVLKNSRTCRSYLRPQARILSMAQRKAWRISRYCTDATNLVRSIPLSLVQELRAIGALSSQVPSRSRYSKLALCGVVGAPEATVRLREVLIELSGCGLVRPRKDSAPHTEIGGC